MNTYLGKSGNYALMAVSFSLGGSALGAFGIFTFHSTFHLVDLKLNLLSLLGLDMGLCMLFFLQHSIMLRKSFRIRLKRFVPFGYHPAVFSITSGLSLLALMIFWQPSQILATAPPFLLWLIRGIWGAACILSFVSISALKLFDPFGIVEIKALIHEKPTKSVPFCVEGAYKFVRHPIYFFSLVMIWFYPNLSLDRLVFNISFTIWMVIGARLEERDLLEHFGEDYVKYRNNVPMLIPYRLSGF